MPFWRRLAHAKFLDTVLNGSCRCITGCLKQQMLIVPIYLLESPHYHQERSSKEKAKQNIMHLAEQRKEIPSYMAKLQFPVN